MGKKYFDITGLVHFARTNRYVTGIQRVEIRVLACLARLAPGDDILCVFEEDRSARLRVCRAIDVFGDEGFDAERFLSMLGLEESHNSISRRDLRDYLAQFQRGSVLRIAKKVEMLFLRKLWPAEARRRIGLPAAPGSASSAVPRVPTWSLEQLLADDSLVFLGSSWDASAVRDLAQTFAQQGGDVVQVIYDLIPCRHPEFCPERFVSVFRSFLVQSIGKTSRYICISEASRHDLHTFLTDCGCGAKSDAWPLAHEFAGYERNAKSASAVNPTVAALAGQHFVLCVGTIEARKNGIGLLRAWKQVLESLDRQAPLLVFAGKYGWKIEDFRQLLASDKRLAAGVRIIDHVSDADLAFLYQNCLLHAYPSLVEGWGLPVGEAAWFGKYSVVSSASSLPEVCGSLVDYVDPTNVDELARVLEKAIQDSDYRQQKEAAIAVAPLRSWKDVASHFGSLLAKKTQASGHSIADTPAPSRLV